MGGFMNFGKVELDEYFDFIRIRRDLLRRKI